jgi:dienelactone hydrolase
LTSKAVQRFHREAEAAARLHHTNIVPVYATGEQDGTHFYAMELVEGPSLNHVLRQLTTAPGTEPAGVATPPSLAQTSPYVEGQDTPPVVSVGGSSSHLSSGSQYFDTAARMVAEVADALEYAHTHGVVHRDIKPANLLLSPDGRLSVNDFGLARVLEEPGVTMTGEFVGTPAFMSPEQITAGRTPLDHRTDIYSLGATLYELLTLRPPFAGERRDEVLAQILHKEPVPPRRLNKKVPADLETICLKCLEKDPDRRYPSAKALADDLRRYLSRFAITAKRVSPVGRLVKLARRNKLATAAGAVIVLLASAAGVTTRLYQRGQADTLAARSEADLARRKSEALQKVGEVERLIKGEKFREGLALLEKEVAPYLPGDPRLEELRSECSRVRSIVTNPPSVSVSRRPIDDPDGGWELLGLTPLNDVRLARGFYRWKLEKPGYESVESLAESLPQVQLDPQGSQPPGMVRVTMQQRPPRIYGLRTRDVKWLPGPFHLDRCEVTNQQFKLFVDQGGYQKKEFWEHPFVKGEKPLSWEEAVAEFRDATGRPGPATWELGSFPDGQAEHPVAGVSWYEAAAYAKFAGKALPTIYHWLEGSGIGLAREIVPRSNFGRDGLAKVGQYPGLGPFGTYDMAGNVKEWCFNSAGGDRRYILGGAWDEQEYMFSCLDSQSPFHRARNCGFRCVKYLPGMEPAEEAFREVKRPEREFLKEKLLTDAEFEFVKRAYTYDDRRDLNVQVVRQEETDRWVRERVEYDAAYGKEPAVAYLFLPRDARPPYQTVIYWPAITAVTDVNNVRVTLSTQAYLIRSGRAFVWPVYKGTFERRGGPVSRNADEWELHKQQVNDLRRALDYLLTRNDLDAGAIGYYGLSWGAMKGAWVLALEDRIKAAVLEDGGLYTGGVYDEGRALMSQYQGPEQDPVHYLPRIRMPVLMLNGEYDSVFPRVENQDPMFQLLGTPAEHKLHRLFKTSHGGASPDPGRVQEAVNWFDRYLGPVKLLNGSPGAAD